MLLSITYFWLPHILANVSTHPLVKNSRILSNIPIVFWNSYPNYMLNSWKKELTPDQPKLLWILIINDQPTLLYIRLLLAFVLFLVLFS